jgi:hypothetical protein
VNTSSELARRYNDASVLENHHAAVGTEVMDAGALLGALTAEQRRGVRKTVLAAVLATDMSHHRELLARVKDCLSAAAAVSSGSSGSGAAEPRFPTGSSAERALLVGFLLHAADLHTPLLPPPLSQRIAGELAREFAAQAEQEAALRLPVTVMQARTELELAQLEIGFIDFVIVPVYTQLAAICPPLSGCLARIEQNRECWAAAAHKRRSVDARRSTDSRRRSVDVQPC